MFGQFLPNKNKILQCSTVMHSDSGRFRATKHARSLDSGTESLGDVVRVFGY
jgi:hypothetical protein